MNSENDKPIEIEPRVERLICRCLDGEAGANERAELAGILTSDQAARTLFEDYARVDKLAAQALRRDLARGNGRIKGTWLRGLGVAAAGAVVTAAAVIGLALLPGIRGVLPQEPSLANRGGRSAVAGGDSRQTSPILVPRGGTPAGLVDYPSSSPPYYRGAGDIAYQRWRGLQRDLIGVRGDDKNVIYILERDKHSTRMVPISGDI